MTKCAVYEDVVQEFELHQLLVLNMDSLPAEMKQRPDVSFLAWGSELRLHDAGKDGGDGWADLMIVDELGKSWIIEVKLSTSAELNANVWHQLMRYRDAATKMNWGDLHNYADRFLDGQGRVKPASDQFAGLRNLVQAVEKWQLSLGRACMPARDLVISVAKSLKAGLSGLAVVADADRGSVVAGMAECKHEGPLAYLCVKADGGKLSLVSKHTRPATCGRNALKSVSSSIVDVDFYKFARKGKVMLTPALLEEGLNPAALAIWRDIVHPRLVALGWDGTVAYRAEKGMTLKITCRGVPAAIIMVGFSSADSKAVSRQFKIHGTYGMRLEFVPWYIKGDFARDDITKNDTEDIAVRLYQLGWRASGPANKTAGICAIPMDAYEKWSYMVFHPSPDERDIVGRDDDPARVDAFFEEIGKFCHSVQ